MSKIEWTDETWNPVVGCSLASPGCTHCYAMRMAARLEAMAVSRMRPDGFSGALDHYLGTTQASKAGPVWTGVVNVAPDSVLTKPLRWARPRRIFVNSMSDLFHPAVPDAVIDRVFAVMALCPQHQFQVLTKRSDRMREYFVRFERDRDWIGNLLDLMDDFGLVHFGCRGSGAFTAWPLPNVWLGVSVEDQARADERIPDLLNTPAAVRWISAEPLLGPVRLWTPAISLITGDAGYNSGIDWVVAGGESGPGARPMHPDWARSLRDQCAAAGVPFLFKQWGEWAPGPQVGDVDADAIDYGLTGKPTATFRHYSGITEPDQLPEGLPDLLRVGKARAGRLLDGVLHDGYPA